MRVVLAGVADAGDQRCGDEERRRVDREEDAHGHEREQCGCDGPASDRKCLRRSLHERIRLLHVRAVDECRDRGAVRGREVAGRGLEQEGRDDEPPERQRAREPGGGDGNEHDAAHEICADHQALPAEPVGREAAVQPEDERGDAVGEPYGDDPERPAGVEREPHQRDVVQRVAELAGGDREVEPPEVAAPEKVQSLAVGGAAPGSSSRGMSRTGSDISNSESADQDLRLAAVTATGALTGDDLSLEDVWAVAVERRPAAPLSEGARDQMRAARQVVERVAHGAHEHTYGVNTGFGRFVSKQIPEELTEELQLRLLRSHACGVGEPYPDAVVRAAMLLRANALAKGNSGARVETVELLLECLNRGVLPLVPARGSVGASGDLAPLAHLALPLVGEGRAWVEGELLDGRGGARACRARARATRSRRKGCR